MHPDDTPAHDTMPTDKQLIADLIARTLAAEKALQLLLARATVPENMHTLLQLNLKMQQAHLPEGLSTAGIPNDVIAASEAAYTKACEAILQAAKNGKFSPPAP